MWERLKPVVKEQRSNPTPAEDRLWQALRRNQADGLQFRRQHAIERFIVDFYCPAQRLIIEVDGPIHDSTVEDDRVRQEFLESLGMHVLRFKNDEVLADTARVIQRITAFVHDHPVESSPSPPAGRGTEGEG